MEKILNDGRPLSKWLILIIDQVIVSWSFAVSFFLIKHFEFENILRGYFFIYLGLYCSISVGVFYLKRIHTGIIRYSNTEDIFRIFSAVIITSVLYWGIVNLMVFPIYDVDRNEIRAGFLINFFISSTLLIMLRIGAKSFFFYIRGSVNTKKDVVLIYGSDHSAILIKSALEGRRDKRYDIIGFLDDNVNTVNKLIEQKEVFHTKDIELLIRKHKVDKLVVMSDDLNSDAKKSTIETCMELGIKVITVPPADQWIYGQLSVNQIKDLKIEDLLQREPIVIQKDNIMSELYGKRVLITGAAGSIGSEIVRQVLGYQPEFVILCDQAESPLHELQLEVEEKFPGARTCMYMADIQNRNRMNAMFTKY